MIQLPQDVKIYMAVQPVTMRKSFDGLAVLVQEVLKHNPLSSHIFVFRNKAADKIKLLWWDRNGFSIYYKRLERGRFKFPKLNKSSITLTQQELELLLDGIDISKLKRLPELHYQAVL
ncbi:MAG: IS66 family insertion sequence element accessory protein TnpB [Gammaproteobacteria bacterium]|jgi:transposase